MEKSEIYNWQIKSSKNFLQNYAVPGLLYIYIYIYIHIKKKKTKKSFWPLFMDGVQLPQGYSHFEEAV